VALAGPREVVIGFAECSGARNFLTAPRILGGQIVVPLASAFGSMNYLKESDLAGFVLVFSAGTYALGISVTALDGTAVDLNAAEWSLGLRRLGAFTQSVGYGHS
jgi:hypothetical protein